MDDRHSEISAALDECVWAGANYGAVLSEKAFAQADSSDAVIGLTDAIVFIFLVDAKDPEDPSQIEEFADLVKEEIIASHKRVMEHWRKNMQ